MRRNYFVANKKAEAKTNAMVLGGSFQPQRVEEVGHCFSRYGQAAVVYPDPDLAVCLVYPDLDTLCPAMQNRVHYQIPEQL